MYKVERKSYTTLIVMFLTVAAAIVASIYYISSIKRENMNFGDCSLNRCNQTMIPDINNSILFYETNDKSKYNDGIMYNSMYYTDNTFENTVCDGKSILEYTKM